MLGIFLLIILAAFIYYLLTGRKRNFYYWKDRGVAQLNPELFYGDARKHITFQSSIGEQYSEFYHKFKTMGVKYGGVYQMDQPVFVPVDPSIVKLILIKDFEYFSGHQDNVPRGLFFNNLFHMDGQPWKDMRRKLTPTFTSGKMKMMFEILREKTNGLTNLVENIAKSGEQAEIKELMARFTTDIIEGLTMEEVTGQCLLFFIAGFETSSTTMSFALLELAHNQGVQHKLRQEIRAVLAKYNGVITYDALQEMTYCENVIQETLRKYPPVSNLPRVCTKTYRIPGSDVVIEKGTTVTIPIMAFQNDPEYFSEPKKFNPDRFGPENKDKIIDSTYMPFGESTRQCLGLKFGMMQSKAGIASLINRFRFTLNERTPYPPKFTPAAPFLSVEGGIWLDIEEVS